MKRSGKAVLHRQSRKANQAGVGDRIIRGLTELRDTLRDGVPLGQRFTVRTVEVPAPEVFDGARVRELRGRLGMSQSVFAKLLGVSGILVQSWEQGVRKPSPVACRLLAEMERDPAYWQGMVVTVPAEVVRTRRKSA